MIRVLHVLGGLERGGAETMVMNLYREIDRTKVQFDFIIHTTKHQAYYKEIIDLGGKVYSFPAFNGKNLFLLAKHWSQFFLEHPEYKILHSHVRSYASLYLPIAKKNGLKTIIHSHSTSNGKGVVSIVKCLMQYPLRNQADFLMACSNEAGQWLYGKKCLKKANYIFQPNAIDVEKYHFSSGVSKQYREELGLENKFVIGHVGRFHEAKNHMFLLEVFSKIASISPQAMLLLVGDGELRHVIEKKISDLQLENRVIMLGSREDVPQLMQAMDVFAFPSMWEGLPVTIVEAQAAGLHCVISEQITKDVDVSNLVTRLPITDAESWVHSILHIDTKRLDVTENIKQAGFDVKDAATNLLLFYESIGEKSE